MVLASRGELLFSCGEHVQYGTTPLIWACRKGHTEIVDMLLTEGAVVDKAGMVSMCKGQLTQNFDLFIHILQYSYKCITGV